MEDVLFIRNDIVEFVYNNYIDGLSENEILLKGYFLDINIDEKTITNIIDFVNNTI